MAEGKSKGEKKPMGCVIVRCKCKNAYQDERYGKGLRVKNRMSKGMVRCTSCAVESGENSY